MVPIHVYQYIQRYCHPYKYIFARPGPLGAMKEIITIRSHGYDTSFVHTCQPDNKADMHMSSKLSKIMTVIAVQHSGHHMTANSHHLNTLTAQNQSANKKNQSHLSIVSCCPSSPPLTPPPLSFSSPLLFLSLSSLPLLSKHVPYQKFDVPGIEMGESRNMSLKVFENTHQTANTIQRTRHTGITENRM